VIGLVRKVIARRQVPSVGDLIRRAELVRVGAEPSPVIGPPPVTVRAVPVDTAVPVELAPTLPSSPWPADPLLGVVRGPLLVERTLRNRAVVNSRYADHGPFPITVWGPFDLTLLGHDLPDQETAA
jgi:hypothetical protein